MLNVVVADDDDDDEYKVVVAVLVGFFVLFVKEMKVYISSFL